jgi:tetratricopeptide (TPR) repeat protein
MKLREALAAAEKTRALAGRRVRVVNGLHLGTFALVALAAALVPATQSASLLAMPAFVALVLAGVVTMHRWNARIVRAINEGADHFSLGDAARAEASYLRVVTARSPRYGAALALHGLGALALRRGDLADAISLFRAAVELSRLQKIPRLRAYGGMPRAYLALASAASGDLDGADRALATPADDEYPAAHAALVLARALVLSRRDDRAAALALLEKERELVRNALAGPDAALAEAVEEHAIRALARPDLRPPRPVSVDAEERAYVLRALPEAEAILS